MDAAGEKDRGYDVYLSHSGLDKEWVACLVKNLTTWKFRVFYDDWELVPGRAIVAARANALSEARKGVIVATAEEIESGWLRVEYQQMLLRSSADRSFSVVPVVFGEIPDLPFLRTVLCVDFQDPSPDAYRQSFYRLLCGLKDTPPGETQELPGELKIPIPQPRTPALAEVGERTFLDTVFNALTPSPILLLLGQADRSQSSLVGRILERARDSYGENRTFHVTPPYSEKAELDRYFARLGRQCGMTDVREALDWEEALDDRLSRDEQLFLLVSGFENGSETGRRQLAAILRGLADRYPSLFQVVLCGGERLAELKYAQGPQHSLLSLAEDLRWPETTAADVLAWQRHDFPEAEIDEATAPELLEICGGHPRLIRRCLQRLPEPPETAIESYRQALETYAFTEQLFLPYRATADEPKVCSLLETDEVGSYAAWIGDDILRRLYWSNLLRVREGKLRWRCATLRRIGRRVLGCAATNGG